MNLFAGCPVRMGTPNFIAPDFIAHSVTHV